MKKLLFCLLLIMSFVLFAGCGSSKTTAEGKTDTTPAEVDESLVVINGLEFHLDKEGSFNGLNYIIPGDFAEAEHPVYIQYSYRQEDGVNLLFYRVFAYPGKDITYAINDLGLDANIPLTDGKTDNIEYKVYEEPRDDGGTIHFYFIDHGDTFYTLNFVSKYDIQDFEQKILNSVKF